MTDSGTETEALLRRMLTDRADRVSPREAPYERIVRQGRAARRRGRVALGAGAAVLAALPGAALASQESWFGSEKAVPAAAPIGQDGPEAGDGGSGGSSSPASPSAALPTPAPSSASPSPPSSSPAAGPSGTAAASEELPAGPSDPGRQLLDGVTLEQARTSLERCFAAFPPDQGFPDDSPAPAVTPGDLRILLAWTAQGDPNRGEDPIRQVFAVSDDPEASPHLQVTCADRPGSGAVGLQSSSGGDGVPEPQGGPVGPDPNAARHYGPSSSWEIPFRWADYGLVAPEVARVTVTHAGVTEEAVLEAGYFVAAGLGQERTEKPPLVRGYDAAGSLLYDSATDSASP